MEANKGEGDSHSAIITSPAAFVEWGMQLQDVFEDDDGCSICLEHFSKPDPSTATNCRHEFHLQCILEWCQRSSQCPMCCQTMGLKDPFSQELFEGVERERKSAASSRATTNTISNQDVEFGVLAMNINEEYHILLHLPSSMRERPRPRQTSHSHTHSSILINPVTEIITTATIQLTSNEMPTILSAPPPRFSFTHRTTTYPSSSYQHGGVSFSGSFKARFNEASIRYKESISRTARDLKERFFSSPVTLQQVLVLENKQLESRKW